jgi:acyl-CoA thioesterase-2
MWGRGQRGAGQRLPLLTLLDLERRGDDDFIARSPGEGPGRLYGGQVAGQTLRAATLTVDNGRLPHSLHSYFIRPGRPGVPLEIHVERTRDGGSFSTRTAWARQQGETIFSLIASFHGGEPGDDWQADGSMPDVPPPDDASIDDDSPARWFGAGFDIRPIRAAEGFRIHPCWVRLNEEIDDDPLLHACALTFISDRAVVGSARRPGAVGRVNAASLDHSLWFHRPVRTDQWLLFSVDPVSNYGGRGLALGTFHTADGVLIASLAQEALLREPR